MVKTSKIIEKIALKTFTSLKISPNLIGKINNLKSFE